MQLSKLEAARRQLETAIKLYFADGDDVSIHSLVAAAYALLRDINEYRGGEPMLNRFALPFARPTLRVNSNGTSTVPRTF